MYHSAAPAATGPGLTARCCSLTMASAAAAVAAAPYGARLDSSSTVKLNANPIPI